MSTPELELGTESKQAHAQLLRLILVGVVATHLLLVASIWGRWRDIALITVACFGVAGFNLVLAQPVFSARTRLAETLRLCGNVLANLFYGHFTDWALPVWIYLPLDAIWVDTGFEPRAR